MNALLSLGGVLLSAGLISPALATNAELTAEAPVAVWKLPAKSGEALLIDVTSEAFDPVLAVQLPGGEYAFNDDSGSLNSQLILTPTADGEIVLAVSSLDRQGVGAYTVTAREIGAAKDGLSAAKDVDGVAILDAAAPQGEEGQPPLFIKGWSLTLEPGVEVTLALTSTVEGADPYLLARLPDGVVLVNDDESGAENLNSKLLIISETGGKVDIAGFSLGGNEIELALQATKGDGSAVTLSESQVSAEEFDSLLNEQLNPPVVTDRPFDPNWYFGQTEAFANLEGQTLSPLPLADLRWRGTALTPKDLEGKVVVLDVWTTWCGPCVAAIPHNEELAKAHPDDVVILGLCLEETPEQMEAILTEQSASYPAAFVPAESRAVIEGLLPIEFFPSYFVLDRQGVVRAAGLSPEYLDEVVATLLAENGAAPAATAPAAESVEAPAAEAPAAPAAEAPAAEESALRNIKG